MDNHNITELQILRGGSGSNAAYVGRAGVLTADMETSANTGFGVIRLQPLIWKLLQIQDLV